MLCDNRSALVLTLLLIIVMTARPIIIDCDPGADDAIALLLALASPQQLDVLGVTTVAGNVSLALTQRNARCICELAGRPDLPVYAGCPRPLLRSLITAEEVHGKTGLDGITLADPQMPLQPAHAVDFLIDTLMDSPGGISVAALGPLTNLAVAIVKQPKICQRIQEIVIMGGAITQGNVTPSAEFNFYVDPHAAHVVLASGIPITLISLDVTHTAIVTPERMAAIRAIDSPVSNAVIGLLEHYSKFDMQRYNTPGPFLHDPCVVGYLLQPDLFTSQAAFVEVETVGEHTIGRTIVDLWRVKDKPPNVMVVQSIEAEGFYQLLVQALAKL